MVVLHIDGPRIDCKHVSSLYRQAFARFLVCGTRLKQLQGKDQLLFERRRGDPYFNGSPVKGGKDSKDE